ncbi:hypothetical protein SH2C18_46230 [Clostridium sediminicola]|uniref:DUF6273 domain-containing protein n=1 Tax=Clostridium sediminicola TaxID=3114879 RepID=UPI0031F1FB80
MKRKLTGLILMFVILITLSMAMTTNSYAVDNKHLSDMNAGDIITFADKEWMILTPNKSIADDKTGCYVVLVNNDGNRPYDTYSNNYADSDLRTYLNNEFINNLGEKNKSLIEEITWDWDPKNYLELDNHTVTDKIGLLTSDEGSTYLFDISPDRFADNKSFWWFNPRKDNKIQVPRYSKYYDYFQERIVPSLGYSYPTISDSKSYAVHPTLYLKPELYVSIDKKIVEFTKSIILNLTTENNQILKTEDGHNTITVSGSVDESDSKIYYRIDGSDEDAGTDLEATIDGSGNFSKEINLSSESEGSHTLYIWAEDTNGNKFGQTTRNFKIDNTKPTITDGNISISGASGIGGAFIIGDTITTTWNNTSAADNNDDISSVTVDFSAFGGVSYVSASNSADTWTATYTIISDSIDATNINVSVTATDNAGNSTTTGDSTNASLDSNSPAVTDGNISISGASSTAATFIIGDTITASWNDTSTGDNNSDTIASVTVDFSSFGGSSAISASNSAATWTASYTITSGDINASNVNISVTATDNAGNSTTTSDSTNATLDTIKPTANKPTLETVSANSIKIISNSSDSGSGLDTNPYLYIRDGNDIGTWTSDRSYTDTGLIANTLYKYKYKSKDKGGNEAESEEVSIYTLALNAESISKKSSSTNSFVFEITNTARQTSPPEHRLELKLKDAGETGENKVISEWSHATTITITGLNDNTEYELWVQTRNSNGTTNAKYKVDEVFKTNRIYHPSSTPSVPPVTPASTKSKIKEAKNIESLKDTLTDIEKLPSSQREEVRQELTKKAIDIMKDLSQLDFMQSTIDDIKDSETKKKYQSRLNGKKMIYSENYKQWIRDNNTSEESNKVWNVKFNSSLDKESIKAEDDYITVVDEDGYRIKVKLEYNEETKILKVLPLNNYEKGKKYYLIMGTKIKNSEGILLDKPIRVEFDIE